LAVIVCVLIKDAAQYPAPRVGTAKGGLGSIQEISDDVLLVVMCTKIY
jgi:hypothetical protein